MESHWQAINGLAAPHPISQGNRAHNASSQEPVCRRRQRATLLVGKDSAEQSAHLTSRADHRRSAMAAARGQVSCTTLLASVHSPHMHACTPQHASMGSLTEGNAAERAAAAQTGCH